MRLNPPHFPTRHSHTAKILDLLLVALLAAVGLLALVSLDSTRIARAQNKTVTPFAFTTETYDFSQSAKGKLILRDTLARRSDGTIVLAVSVPEGPGAKLVKSGTFPIRTVMFLDGRTVEVFDPIHGVIEWPRASEKEIAFRKARMFNTASKCINVDEYVAGHATLLGEKTVILKQLPEGSSGLTAWRSPDFGCETLQYTKTRVQSDGSFKTVIEQKLVRLKLGHPPAALFAIPSAYAKLIPSQALKEEMKLRGVQWGANLERRAQSEDADYYRRLRASSPSKQ
jgi:hypothetical protein